MLSLCLDGVIFHFPQRVDSGCTGCHKRDEGWRGFAKEVGFDFDCWELCKEIRGHYGFFCGGFVVSVFFFFSSREMDVLGNRELYCWSADLPVVVSSWWS